MELKSIIKKEIKSYPKDEELKVMFYTDIPMGVTEYFVDNTISDKVKTVKFVKAIVADWNFADENGTKLEITDENIERLGIELVTWIVQQGNEFIKPDADKKKE